MRPDTPKRASRHGGGYIYIYIYIYIYYTLRVSLRPRVLEPGVMEVSWQAGLEKYVTFVHLEVIFVSLWWFGVHFGGILGTFWGPC